jgi:hypothetical protein
MRAGFGLVGILVTVGVIVWLWSQIVLPHDKAVIDAGRKATTQLNQIAGNSADGTVRFDQSLEFDVTRRNGRINDLIVLKVKPGGPAETFYGLKKNDFIIEIGPLSVRDQISSKEEANDFLMDAYQRSQPIQIIRNGQKLTLPLAGASTPQQQMEHIQKSLGGK